MAGRDATRGANGGKGILRGGGLIFGVREKREKRSRAGGAERMMK